MYRPARLCRLQLTIVLIYLKNTRGKMIKKLNARMDGGDLLRC